MSRPFFVLAPMDDVTDTVFRRIVHECGPADLYVTEFVNVDGLCSPGRQKLMPKLDTSQDIGTVYAQIWGKRPENFKQIAYEISLGLLGDPEYESWLARELGSDKAQGSKENRGNRTSGTETETRIQLTQRFVETVKGANSSAGRQFNGAEFSGVDINFGCPDKAVVKNECCSAMQQPELRDKARAIIEATIEGLDGKLPLSLKTRLGFKEIDYTWHEFLLGFKPKMLTIHVRTTKQMSKVPAQWDAILPIIDLRNKISPETKIVLNGDIKNREHGEELAEKYGVDGIMIGRGIFHDPYCFSVSAPWNSTGSFERIELFKKHLELFQETYKEGERKFNPLKKFAKVYISDFPGAVELRDKIMQTQSIYEALKLLSIANK